LSQFEEIKKQLLDEKKKEEDLQKLYAEASGNLIDAPSFE